MYVSEECKFTSYEEQHLCSIACHVYDVFFTVNLKIDSNILLKKTMFASNRASIQVTIRIVQKVKNKNKEEVGCKAASLEIKTVSTICIPLHLSFAYLLQYC